MSQHDASPAFVSYGASAGTTFLAASVRPNLRLAYPLPVRDRSSDTQFAALLDALAQRTGRARQIGGENVSAL